MTKLRLGLVGLGMAVTPHAKSLIDLSDRVEVVAAYSPSAPRRAAFAARWPFPIVNEASAIFDDPSIDAVGILTPPNAHGELAARAAAAGKHVLLEKPLEISMAQSVALVDACERAKVVLAVCLQHRFRPAGLRLRMIMAGGRLGDLVGASASMRLWRPQTYYDQPGRGTRARDGGGVLLSQGIHTLDLFGSLVGGIGEVTGFATTSSVHRMETEDLVCAALRTHGGALGVIEATTAAYPGTFERIELIGRHGTATLTGNTLAALFHDGTREDFSADVGGGGTGADPMDFPHDAHRAVWADFLAAIETGAAPRVSGREALKVHRLIEALLATAAEGRRVTIARD